MKQDLLNKKIVFENFIKWGLKGGVSIDADSGPLEYVLWCCGSRSWEVFTFFQIGSAEKKITVIWPFGKAKQIHKITFFHSKWQDHLKFLRANVTHQRLWTRPGTTDEKKCTRSRTSGA